MFPTAPDNAAAQARIRLWQATGIALLLALSIMRSNWATRLDGFGYDEPYHLLSGVLQFRNSDFRLNPEQGPLVKLWVGAWMDHKTFRLPPPRPLTDKRDDHHFAETAVYLENDPDLVQSRVRIAMFAYSGLVLAAFAWILWRTVSPGIALGTVVFLAIDPTIAAHMPTVMMDLSVGILAISSILTAAYAFRTWRRADFLLASLVLGLALGAKHSNMLLPIAVALLGITVSVWARKWSGIGWTAGILLGAVCILWFFYGFRYTASVDGIDQFSRPLKDKITDLRSPSIRAVLTWVEAHRLLPRSYIWGMADTIRSGIEGRSLIIHAFGKSYSSAPWYFFPGVLAVKIPLGLLVVSLGGLVILVRKRGAAPPPLLIASVYSLLLLVFLIPSPGYYGGIKHAFPVFISLATLAGLALDFASRSGWLARILCGSALIAACGSALPVSRPWEYHNELAGSTQGAYQYFSNESVDIGQRSKELIEYYNTSLRPAGETPYLIYDMSEEQIKRRNIRAHYLGSPEGTGSANSWLTGTFLLSSVDMAPSPADYFGELRRAKPAARFGNLFVYRGIFYLPEWRAWDLYYQALELIYAQAKDPVRAEQLLEEAVKLRPMMFGPAIELGNLAARRGDREAALRAYRLARKHVPSGDATGPYLEKQIDRLLREDPKVLEPVRNPWLE